MLTEIRSKKIALEVLHGFKKNTQNKQVLTHLYAIGAITPLVALDRYGCLRLSARIKDLRVRGVPIETRKITRNGKTFAEYRLEGDDVS